MATTDTRSGFRLPWSTDRSASRETTADPAESSPDETALDTEPGLASDVDDEHTTIQDATGDAVRSEQEEPVTILAPDTAPTHAHVGPAPAHEPSDETHVETAQPAAAATAAADAPTRRPTKFLADLTRAMQAAAEQARTATIEQYQADGTAVIEEIHATSATTVVELRSRADDDVAGIKDWSKAEIARIREETEQRIAARREQLEGQLERHAALVDHEIERVRGQLATFQEAMGRFFDDLAGEEDPSRFAARAANLPEPPQFAPVDEDAVAALLGEPGIGAPPPAAPDAAVPAAVEAVADVSEPEAVAEAVVAEEQAAEPEPFDREAALAAIQAAAEAAEASEAAEARAEAAEARAAEAQAAEAQADPVEVEAQADPVEVEAAGSVDAVADTEPAPDASDSGPFSGELDPRLAMLGLEPDFAAAAEVAAAEAAAADVDAIPEIEGDALAARLSGLVPDQTQAQAEMVTTQVVTSGLVSVASIASFKRHLGRLTGVTHVGVSSGPDGEFVFTVQHETATSLRDLVPTIPGFGARVTNAGDGFVHVSAQDPQD